MTVGQLITELQHFDPNQIVIDTDGNTPNFAEIEDGAVVLIFDPEAQEECCETHREHGGSCK